MQTYLPRYLAVAVYVLLLGGMTFYMHIPDGQPLKQFPPPPVRLLLALAAGGVAGLALFDAIRCLWSRRKKG